MAATASCSRPVEPTAATAATPTAAGVSPWRSCRLPGLSEPAQCTTLAVFENRTARSGRRLAIHVARLKATSRTPATDAVIFVAGGPGQAASDVAAHVLPGLSRVRRDRDLLFVDLRGTGRSAPLRCIDPERAGRRGTAAELRQLFSSDVPAAVLRRCRAGYDADLRHYTTANAVDDLEQLRRALKLGRVNIIGVSYGTRVALTWMRRYPAALRAAIVDGVAPPQMTLFAHFAADAERAWRLLVRDCAAKPGCKRRFPTLATALSQLLAKLPMTVAVTHPASGVPAELHLSRATVAMAIRGLLYSAELAALLPLVIEQALAGQWQPLVAQTLLLAGSTGDSMSLGLMLSTVCVEDVPLLPASSTASSAASDVATTFLGVAATDAIVAMCARWPLAPSATIADARRRLHSAAAREVAVALAQPVTSDVPTLLLSGEADPATPPRWAELARRSLSRAHHVVFPGMAHGVASRGCGPRLMASFLAGAERPGMEAVAVRCRRQSQRPAFFLSVSGPAP